MYNSSKEYLIYLQRVLKQTDINDYLNLDKINKFYHTQNCKIEDYSKNNLLLPENFQQTYKETLKAYNSYFNKKNNIENPIEDVLTVLINRIMYSLSIDLRNRLENIEIGSLFKLYPNAMFFKDNNYLVILISSALLQLIYNNICLLEAISFPDNVTFFSYSDTKLNLSKLNTEFYSNFQNNYINNIKEVSFPYPIIFTFNDYSMDIVIDHFELITVFIIFHEYAHYLNNDLNNNQHIHSKINEFNADSTALELMLKHYIPYKYKSLITETDLILMIEYYLFRFIYAINITANNHPSPGERVINLVEKTISKIQFRKEDIYKKDIYRLKANLKLFKEIYKMEKIWITKC